MTKQKLTLDDVLLKLQNDHAMTAITETDKVTGGRAPVLDECHPIAPAPPVLVRG